MRCPRRICWIAWLPAALLLGGCGGAATGLVIIPDQAKKATVPEGKYQDVHAVYLYDIGHVHFDPVDIGHTYAPNYAYTHHAKIKLLTRAATESTGYGNIFVRHLGELYDIAASVLKTDGKRVELKKNDFITNVLIKDVVPGATPPIHYFKTAIIFPGLEPGDVIAYHYTKRHGGVWNWQFNKLEAPVMFSKYMVARPPRRAEIQPVIVNRHGLDVEHEEQKGMATGMAGYTGISRQATYDVWRARSVPAITAERAMPPLVDLASGIGLWVGSKRWSWNILGNTYHKWFGHYGRGSEQARALAEKVTEGAGDTTAKAKAIHRWVKDNLTIKDFDRLTPVPRQIEITTVDIEKLLDEKIATPEQAGSLMYLMMQAVGVEPSLVLATGNRHPPAQKGVPSIQQFHYPFLALDESTFIDTTDRFCPFGRIPWEYEGRKALWIKDGTVSFRRINPSTSADNQRAIRITSEVEPAGSLKVIANFKLTGHMAYAYRRWLGTKIPDDRQEAIRGLVSAASPKAEMDDFVIKGLEDPDAPMELVLTYHVAHHAQLMQDKMILKLDALIHHTRCPVCSYPTTAKRENPVWFPFERLDEVDVTVTFPTGFLLQALPKGFRTRHIEKGTAVGVQTSYGSDGGKNLRVLRKFSVNETTVGKNGYDALKKLIKTYLAQKDTLITLELPKMD